MTTKTSSERAASAQPARAGSRGKPGGLGPGMLELVPCANDDEADTEPEADQPADDEEERD